MAYGHEPYLQEFMWSDEKTCQIEPGAGFLLMLCELQKIVPQNLKESN